CADRSAWATHGVQPGGREPLQAPSHPGRRRLSLRDRSSSALAAAARAEGTTPAPPGRDTSSARSHERGGRARHDLDAPDAAFEHTSPSALDRWRERILATTLIFTFG